MKEHKIESFSNTEIQNFEPPVIVQVGHIDFPDYSQLLEEARFIASQIEKMEVTEDNVKDTKKILANVNKAIKKLNDKRIQIKKDINEPYETFAQQIKDIETVIKDADTLVRNQVRQMEETEREEKRRALEDIWDKRIDSYAFVKIFTFDDWLEPKHLNKTESMNKIEQDMTTWFEKVERDLVVLSNMEYKDELFEAYAETQDVAISMEVVRQSNEKKNERKQILQEETGIESFIVEVTCKKDLTMIEMFMKENNIEYTLR